MMNKTNMVPAMDLKSNVDTDPQGRRRQLRVVVKSMGVCVTLSAFNGMLGVSLATEKQQNFLGTSI